MRSKGILTMRSTSKWSLNSYMVIIWQSAWVEVVCYLYIYLDFNYIYYLYLLPWLWWKFFLKDYHIWPPIFSPSRGCTCSAFPGYTYVARQATTQSISSVIHAMRLGLYKSDDPSPTQLAADLEDKLFANILNKNNPQHVLHDTQNTKSR